MPDYTKFKGVTDFNKNLLKNELERNLQLYLNWCFLGIGAWSDVEITTPYIKGGNFETLHCSLDPAYTNYTVWETPRKNLVYEDITFNGSSPIVIDGVYVNGTKYASNHSTYGHNIDYINGRVIFNSARLSTDIIKLEYSYKNVSIEICDDSELWKEIQNGSYNVADNHISNAQKGEWTAIQAQKRQQLPAIIIEAVPRRFNKPYQLGSQSLLVYQDVLFHVLAETRNMRNNLCDILSFQEPQVIWLIDSDQIVGSTDWPLTYLGYKNQSGLIYPDLVEQYKWLTVTFKETTESEVQNIHPRLFEGTVRCKMEIVFTKE